MNLGKEIERFQLHENYSANNERRPRGPIKTLSAELNGNRLLPFNGKPSLGKGLGKRSRVNRSAMSRSDSPVNFNCLVDYTCGDAICVHFTKSQAGRMGAQSRVRKGRTVLKRDVPWRSFGAFTRVSFCESGKGFRTKRARGAKTCGCIKCRSLDLASSQAAAFSQRMGRRKFFRHLCFDPDLVATIVHPTRGPGNHQTDEVFTSTLLCPCF